MRAKFISESINFERGGSAMEKIGIGLSSKRIFKDVEEVVDWAELVPYVYTDGVIQEWGPDDFVERDPVGRDDTYSNWHYIDSKKISKLEIIRWMKWNIIFEDDLKYKIAVRDAKKIVDQLELRLNQKFFGYKSNYLVPHLK